MYLRHDASSDSKQDLAVSTLEKAGQPVVRIKVPDTYDVAQEFFRWEIATAIAGSIIGINAFNQPDVEASKIETRKLTSEYEQKGSSCLRRDASIFEGDGVVLLHGRQECRDAEASCGQRRDARGLPQGSSWASESRRLFRATRLHPDDGRLRTHGAGNSPLGSREKESGHVRRIRPPVSALHRASVQGRPELRGCSCRSLATMQRTFRSRSRSIRSACGEGGAGARASFQVLADRDRRALRVHLGADVSSAGLDRLRKAIEQALA